MAYWRSGKSITWKSLSEIKKKVEQNFIWVPKEGNISIWFDNWTKHGPLYKLLPDGINPKDILLKDILEGGTWKYDASEREIPIPVKNIVEQYHIMLSPGVPDTVIWAESSTGKFSVTSAWECLRRQNME